ncbi:MAG: hypothetical protein NVSMB13_06150 [Mycobacteriales bacterium]
MTAGTRPTGTTVRPVAKVGSTRRSCPECGERLSSYNPGPNCWTHTVGIPWRGPTAKPK